VLMDGYTEIDSGTVPPGVRWEVGRQGERLLVAVGGSLISLNGAPRDRFAEAVARAVTPGQASG